MLDYSYMVVSMLVSSVSKSQFDARNHVFFCRIKQKMKCNGYVMPQPTKLNHMIF